MHEVHAAPFNIRPLIVIVDVGQTYIGRSYPKVNKKLWSVCGYQFVWRQLRQKGTCCTHGVFKRNGRTCWCSCWNRCQCWNGCHCRGGYRRGNDSDRAPTCHKQTCINNPSFRPHRAWIHMQASFIQSMIAIKVQKVSGRSRHPGIMPRIILTGSRANAIPVQK